MFLAAGYRRPIDIVTCDQQLFTLFLPAFPTPALIQQLFVVQSAQRSNVVDEVHSSRQPQPLGHHHGDHGTAQVVQVDEHAPVRLALHGANHVQPHEHFAVYHLRILGGLENSRKQLGLYMGQMNQQTL